MHRHASEYGDAIVPPDFIEREWGHAFALRAYIDEPSRYWQAVAVMQRIDAVGNRVTPVPPHRSRRAAFPHRAPIEGRTRSRVWTPPIRRLAASVTCQFRY